MERKSPRSIQPASKGVPPDSKKIQDGSSSNREPSAGLTASKNELHRNKPSPLRFARNFDKRPRAARGGGRSDGGGGSRLGRTETTRLAVNGSYDEFQAELGSVFLPGSKKQSQIRLNFVYPPVGGRDRAASGFNRSGDFKTTNNSMVVTRKHQYNKEHFLQANCQFIVNASGNYKEYMSNPDALVEWNLIEQINALVSEFPSCPICLHLPIAAKITRCGHIYCWSCILHYLSLSPEKWRKCPICYEAIHKNDLKSVVGIVYKTLNIGETITFKLMKRPKGSLITYSAETTFLPTDKINEMLKMCENDASNINSKLLLANYDDILSIINREKNELQQQILDDEQCSEHSFIETALKLLDEREKQLFENLNRNFEDSLKLNDLDLNNSSNAENNEIDKVSLDDDWRNMDFLDNNQQDQSKFYFFYQASDGQHIYLHAINARMLEHTYGSLEKSPRTLTGKILEKDGGSMTKEIRKRLRYLQHLPVTCQFEIAEIELTIPVVSKETIQFFSEQLEIRCKRRQRRAKEERKREKRIADEESRIMGKSALVVPPLHIDSQLQFPDIESSVRSEHYSSDGNSSREPTPANSLSTEMEYQGPSFAKMLISNAKKLNTSNNSKLKSCTPSMRLINVTGADMKSNLAVARSTISDSETENGDYDNVAPTCNRKLGDEIFKALQNAEKGEAVDGNGLSVGKKKKKKNKQKLLFTTSVAYFGN